MGRALRPAPHGRIPDPAVDPVVGAQPRSTNVGRAVSTGAHLLSLVGGFVVLLHANRGQWFWGDEWAFLAHRRVALAGEHGLWAPHSEHWSTLPILIYRALFATVGLRTYVPYVVVLVLLHLAVAHALW